ncbi:MAG TPA: ATP-binding protein [Candidatus Acidoferrum sp.]|nr:ATP-binding protein [Candidatus Acidoferrum sp.]
MRELTAVAATLVGATLLTTYAEPETALLLRHLYLVPVIVAALRFGLIGGGMTAATAVLLDAPRVFATIERDGLTQPAAEHLITFVLLIGAGALVGRLAAAAHSQRQRFETLLAVQRALTEEAPLEVALQRVRACLAARLGVGAIGLIVRQDDRVAVAGGGPLVAGSLAAEVLETGRPQFVPDVGGGARPRRAFVAPLLAAGEPIGALAVEREGELTAAERGAIATLAAHCGLALENARLASRQRRFTEELAERIASATATKSAFVAVASHELRTPLTALLGFSELLAKRTFETAEVQRMSDVMNRETERLVRIVDDFLDLSRIERGFELRLSRSRVDVAAAVASAVEVLRRAGSHELVVECEDALPAVDADADALDRILKNLVSNAMKYSPPGTAVRVAARARDGAGVEFSVHDAGRGIPPEALPHVFEPYYRAPGVGSARGAGLGLAVVKSLIDAHGGVIDLESEPGRGTRVTFVIPASLP